MKNQTKEIGMRQLRYMILSLALLAPFGVSAQAPDPAPAPAAAAAEAPKADAAATEESAGGKLLDSAKKHLEGKAEEMATDEEAAELPGLIGDATAIYSEWKTGGWMAGLLALVTLLMNLLRFGPINEFFRVKQLMWLKPILAAAFGAVAAGIGAGVAGAAVGPSLIAGVLAGLGAVGLYEVTKRRKAENRAK